MRTVVCLLALTSLFVVAVAGASAARPGRELQVAKGCVCPAVYKPVCGVKNGVRRTYSNSCQAGCNGATIVEQDACGGGANTQAGNSTGGRKLAAAATCVCPALYKPVCGANGKTFGNACEATCKGVAPQCWGACPCPRCICTAQYTPVCGIDGVTYGNACQASCKRIPVAHTGPCLGEEGDICGGIAGRRCEEGLVCVAPATPDAQGVCKPAPGPADGSGGSPVVGKGESCGGRRIGPSPVCAAGFYCKTNPRIADAPGVCTRIPRSGVNEPCGGFPPPGTQPPTCKSGLTCKTDPRVPDKPGVCQ